MNENIIKGLKEVLHAAEWRYDEWSSGVYECFNDDMYTFCSEEEVAEISAKYRKDFEDLDNMKAAIAYIKSLISENNQ